MDYQLLYNLFLNLFFTHSLTLMLSGRKIILSIIFSIRRRYYIVPPITVGAFTVHAVIAGTVMGGTERVPYILWDTGVCLLFRG